MQTLITAFLSFVSTNIDDIFILTLLFSQAGNKRERLCIAVGQYLGIGALFAVSVLGALGAQILPAWAIGLLGFVPIALGIKEWVVYRREKEKEDSEEAEKKESIRMLEIAFLTIANGADNIGVYVPVFSGFSLADFMLTLSVFAVLVAVWCFLGYRVGADPWVKEKLEKYKHILVPVVLIALGVFILAENYIF